MRQVKWSDNEVVVWGYLYLAKESTTLMAMEELLGISHSTFWVCFQKRLYRCDSDLYDQVMEKLDQNRHKGGRKKAVRY